MKWLATWGDSPFRRSQSRDCEQQIHLSPTHDECTLKTNLFLIPPTITLVDPSKVRQYETRSVVKNAALEVPIATKLQGESCAKYPVILGKIEECFHHLGVGLIISYSLVSKRGGGTGPPQERAMWQQNIVNRIGSIKHMITTPRWRSSKVSSHTHY